MVLDVNGNTLDAKFLRENGVIADYFTIVKGTVVPLPAPPSALTATAVSRTQINLSWTDNADNETGFRIERCKNVNCTNFVQITQVGANVTTFADTTVAKNSMYSYRVRAFNTAGNSAYSNTANAKTPK
jgi:hypothetical protein